MSIASKDSQDAKSFKINGKVVEIIVPLFGWLEVSMINILTRQVEKRLIWNLSNECISLYGSAKHGGSVLKDNPIEYSWENVPVSTKHPQGIRPIRKRVEVSGLVMCSLKLSSGLLVDKNNQNLPISPDALRRLCEDAISNGHAQETGNCYKIVLVRTCDLRRDPNPRPDDHWICIGGSFDHARLQSSLPTPNQCEEALGSAWRIPNEAQEGILIQY